MHPFSTSYLYLRDRRLSRDDQTSVCPATSSRFSGETPKNSISPACPGLPTSLLSPGSELLILPLRPFRGSQGHISRKQSQSFSHNLQLETRAGTQINQKVTTTTYLLTTTKPAPINLPPSTLLVNNIQRCFSVCYFNLYLSRTNTTLQIKNVARPRRTAIQL